MLAMVAVGAWSAQLGGRAIFYVPAAFVCAMAAGGVLGFQQMTIPGTELAISFSVLALGAAIALGSKLSLLVAAVAVALFGLSHGYAHGHEIPASQVRWQYAAGFLATTAALHVIGAVGGLLLLESKNGKVLLRLAGTATAFAGTAFLEMLL
jgi:urease accessory protein